MISRKMQEIGSGFWRSFLFPFVRVILEIQTHSVMKQKSYINQGTILHGRNYLGKYVYLTHVDLGFGSYVSDRGTLKNVKIGKYTSIGTDVKSISGKHPIREFVSTHPAFYSADAAMGFTYTDKTTFDEYTFLKEEPGYQISIGNDVWIGNGVSIMEGVVIGDGAVIGAGALVTKSVEPYAIYVGVPAKKVGVRFNEEQVVKLEKIKWWNQDEKTLRKQAKEFEHVDSLIRTFYGQEEK